MLTNAHTKPQLFTRGPSTYKIPSVNDIPIDFRVKLFADAPNRQTVYSSKVLLLLYYSRA